MAVQIIVDSSADLAADYVKENDIQIVPLKTIFPDGEYVQGVNLSVEEFYEKLIESTEIPRTSQATPFEFQQFFERVAEAGDTAVVITLSSKLSGTFNSAVVAATEFPGIHVVDSLNVTIGQQLLVKRAIQMRAEGLDAETIAANLNEERHDVQLIALLDTLEYLKKGGRISAAVAFAGGVLGIKPAITVTDGEIELIGKARGSKQGNNLLRSKIFESGGVDFERPLLMGYTGLSDTLLRKYMRDSQDLYAENLNGEPEVHVIGSVIGTHAGPGAIVTAFFRKERF